MDKSLVKNASHYYKKEEWGEGEWLNEPGMDDTIEFEYKGYTCFLTRNFGGAWCGYVGIPLNSYYSIQENYEMMDVHGGVSWYHAYLPWNKENKSLFWLGFDCSHYLDYSPRMEKLNEQNSILFPALAEIDLKFAETIKSNRLKRTYRTLEFATDQLKSLVDQIKERDDQEDKSDIVYQS